MYAQSVVDVADVADVVAGVAGLANGFYCKRGIKNAQQIEMRSIIIIVGAQSVHRIIAFPCNCSILNSTRSCLSHNDAIIERN